MATKIEKPELIRLHLMRGSSTKEKTVKAKLKSGIIEYPDMARDETIVYFGQGGYAIYDIKSKKMELYYDVIKKTLIKLADLGGTPQSDSIADLTRNFTIAAKKAEDNIGANDYGNNTGKWALGMILILAVLTMVFMYLEFTHVPGGGATSAAVSGNVPGTLIHINTGT